MAILTFTINYHTAPGELVCLCGTAPGGSDDAFEITLAACGDDWLTTVNMEKTSDITYHYIIRKDGHTVRREWGDGRKIHVIKSRKEFLIRDFWKDRPDHAYLYSDVFTDAVFRHRTSRLPGKYYARTVLLNVLCPYVAGDRTLVICGECGELGAWNPKRGKQLSCAGRGEWQITLDAKKLPPESEYKFVIVDRESGEAVCWEEGENRVLSTEGARGENVVLAEMSLLFHCQGFAFRGTGTAIPVFSLRTDRSYGSGDFADLRKMIDWAALTRQQIIQLLPVNDTSATRSWRDSYPYNAISSCALHPLYLGCGDYPLNGKRKLNAFQKEARQLNSLRELDYEKVLSLKLRYARELYLQQGEQILASEEYLAFRERNESWLFPYTCYCYLRDRYGCAGFDGWGEYAVYDEESLRRMVDTDAVAGEETQYWSFLQYLLHRQFSFAKAYAHEKGVALKGDMPVGISRNSVDVWVAPALYRMETQAGAPPDSFSAAGQNWGFPACDWQAMAGDGYAWWVNRFRKMADCFDACRIDHILGYFRLWEIPPEAVWGSLGHFSPAQPLEAEEIVRAGIPFDEERMVEPFIHDRFLSDIFAEYAGEVKEMYLDAADGQQFRLKSGCDTQRKIRELFEGKRDDKSRKICDGLMLLCTEVLFVRDMRDGNRFHPRIAAQNTHSYRYLDAYVREMFDRLHDSFFYHRHDSLWREEAMKKLPTLISSTGMMVCGEDLGMVAGCVPSVMQELQILGLEVERMPKDPHTAFTDLQQVPGLSVCTTSTHDMSPLRLWWTENRELTQRYHSEVLHREGDAPAECDAAICRQIVENHLHSPAMWVILPLQDWLSIDGKLRRPDAAGERVNDPSDPEYYWRYRMHLSLDDLLEESAFNGEVEALSRR
ncbi:MAG: 4-alpha-glucanotransferase [Proteiniphilum sp.]|jgi:4-alpha-glucanotransferase|nr:4-alpha-glucanotransferase [Proteiniphilum sp.]